MFMCPDQEIRNLQFQYPNWIIYLVPHKLSQSGFDSMDPDKERPADIEILGHELLSFLFHYVHKNLSTLDPTSLATASLRSTKVPASKAVCWLNKHTTS
jgi:hypothetical protein